MLIQKYGVKGGPYMAKDYADIICEAVDEIVSQRLKDISFDTTIECIIYDASEADQGKYVCSNGSAKFIAYSENTKYKKDDAVLVSIPQGDYNKQKTIISKQVTDSTQSVNFQRPFDTIVDATSNLIKGDQGTNFLRANQNYNSTLTEQDVTLLEIWSRTFEEPLCGYTRLGLQAQFMTWLKSFKCREGNYGLMVRIVANSAEIAINDNRLTSLEKLLLIHIVSLCKNRDYCWATNGGFCDIYKVSRQTISKSINNLTKLGYLRNDYDKFKVNSEKRKIFLSDTFKLEIKSIKQWKQCP